MFGRDLLEVPGAVRLVVDDDVLRRHRLAVAEVLLQVVLDVADEGLAAAAGAAQFLLQYLDQRTVAAKEDGRGCRLARGPLDRQVVKRRVVNGAQPDQRLAGAWGAGDEDRVRLSGIAVDVSDELPDGLRRVEAILNQPIGDVATTYDEHWVKVFLDLLVCLIMKIRGGHEHAELPVA